MSKELEALERGIIEFEKNLEDDPNNDWLKRTIAGMKKCYQRLESIDNAKPSEALESLRQIGVIETYHRDDGTLLKDSIMFKPEYDTIKQALLKAQEQEKVLEIIKKKCLYTDNLNEVATCLNYNYYKERMSKKYDTKVVKTDWNDKVLLDYLKLLTQEEFELVKRYFK